MSGVVPDLGTTIVTGIVLGVTAMGDPALVVATWGLVAVSGWFANRQIAAQRDVERVRLTMDRRDRYESEEMQRYRRLLAEQLRSLPPGEMLPRFDPAVPNFFDVTGSLLRKEYLARDLIDNFFGYAAKRYWHALKATLEYDRVSHPSDDLWCDFRYLIEQLGGSSPTDDEMRGFWKEETSLQPYVLKLETPSASHGRGSTVRR